jgi:hypothetical protein
MAIAPTTVATATTTTAVSATTSTTAAAAAATAAVTTATPAATATAESTATTAATGAFFLGSGFIDGQGATVVLLTVEGRDGGLGLFVGRHLDKTEPLAAAGVAIVDDLGRDNCAVGSEKFLES